MNRIRHIIGMVAVLLTALTAGSCVHPLSEYEYAELMVSLYIPDVLSTKAETGPVHPVGSEGTITSLQIWVFYPENAGEDAGKLITYKELKTNDLDSPFDPSGTGLPNSTITRFALPLNVNDFTKLSADGAKADVYAVANADPDWGLLRNTSRADLEAFVLKDELPGSATFGATNLTKDIPTTGLPMSGVLKGADVNGGYPVLNISTLTLKRAVSKIRFVFIQQAKADDPATPFNANCIIQSIQFDATSKIANSEYLFTQNNIAIKTDDGYSKLADITADNGTLIPNAKLARAVDPEIYAFRSEDYLSETAQEYETRLDDFLKTPVEGFEDGFPESQIGPIYIRETDQPISGTITYKIAENGPERTATFTMDIDGEGHHDILSRNHSWIVFAYFAEETMTLNLTVQVLPWTYSSEKIDFQNNSVNVIRRFQVIMDSPPRCKREEMPNVGNYGFIDVTFWHTFENEPENNVIKGDILIATPVGAKLHAFAVPGHLPDADNNPVAATLLDPPVFLVSPEVAIIYRKEMTDPLLGKIEACRIEYTIQCNPYYRDARFDEQLEGHYIDLHFAVEIGNDQEWIDIGSESLDYYRFVLSKHWNE